MKAKMTTHYSKAWIIVTGAVILLAFFAGASVLSLKLGETDTACGVIFLCALFSVLILIAVYCRFNYGLKISEKRVIAISKSKLKVLRYDDVSSITVEFTNTNVVARIKTKYQKEYVFDWDDIFLDAHYRNWARCKILINSKFVEKSIDSLSKCPRVKIRNRYKPKKQDEEQKGE